MVMPRHSSPASPSIRYLAASDFELIVGGAGKHDLPETNLSPFGPSAGFAAGGDSAVAPPMSAGAADGPGFTWPADTVQAADHALPAGSFAVGPPSAGAADGAGFTWPADMQDQLIDGGDVGVDGVPHMGGTIVPDGPPDADSSGDDGAGGDWVDSAQDWDHAGAPMTLDGLDSVTPYEVSSLPDEVASDAAMADDVGTAPDWPDVMPYEVNEVGAEPITAQPDHVDQGGGCHAAGGGDGDGGGQHHGDGGGQGDGGGHHGDGGQGDGGGHDGGHDGHRDDGANGGAQLGGHHDGTGGGHGHHHDDDARPEGQQVAATQHQDDPMSWTSSVPAQIRDHVPALASVDVGASALGRPPGNADLAPHHQAAPQAHGGNDGSNILDWAFSPRGPIAGAIGGDLAQNIWGNLGNLGDRLRR